MKKTKIGIIGIGNVGAHVLYTLALQGLAQEFVLIDIDEKKAGADLQDVFDCAMYLPHPVHMSVGTFSDLKDCDIIVYSVGKIDLLRQGHNRLTELNFNIPAAIENARKIKESGFTGILINISNPCDIVTRELANRLGLPKGHVFGTGTGLDTARLVASLSKRTGIDAKSITAYMLGEHGNDQFTPWSCVSFHGRPLADWAKTDARFRFDLQEAEHAAVEGGWKVYYGKFRTEYAIAMTAARAVHAVLFDENRILPVSFELDGEYGESGIFAGVPAIVGQEGVKQVVELPLREEEKERFHVCCEGIRRNIGYAQELYS